MAILKALCWALIFIIRIRFPPGTSLVTYSFNLHGNLKIHNVMTGSRLCICTSILGKLNIL